MWRRKIAGLFEIYARDPVLFYPNVMQEIKNKISAEGKLDVFGAVTRQWNFSSFLI